MSVVIYVKKTFLNSLLTFLDNTSKGRGKDLYISLILIFKSSTVLNHLLPHSAT